LSQHSTGKYLRLACDVWTLRADISLRTCSYIMI